MAKKKEVTNEMLLRAIVALAERVDGLVTKEEFEYLKTHAATEKHISALMDEFELLGQEFDELKSATKEDIYEAIQRIRSVEKSQGEILDIIQPLARARDKDSVAVVDLERRVTRIESRLSTKR